MFSNPLTWLILLILAIVGGAIWNSNRQARIRREQRTQTHDYDKTPEPITPRIYDPLDGDLLENGVNVTVKTSKGDVTMMVNRHNAKTLNTRGLSAFPYFRKTFSKTGTNNGRCYNVCFGDGAFDLIEYMLFYDFFFADDDCVIYDDNDQEVVWADAAIVEEVIAEVAAEVPVEDTVSEPEPEHSVAPDDTTKDVPYSSGYGDSDSGGYDSGDSGGGDCGGGDCGGD